MNPDPNYIAQLDQLILSALRLGFMDDVKHWRELRAQLIREAKS